MQDHQTDQENMILVHMQKAEAHGLDAGQGGMELDEETQLRSYRGWEELIKHPNVQELFNGLMADTMEDGDVDPPFSTEYNQVARTLPPWEPAPGDSNPTFAELAAKGRGGDDVVVWLPQTVVAYFGKLKHGLSENPETGLIEFGFWKSVGRVVSAPFRAVGSIAREAKKVFPEVLRVGGTLAGFALGGPMGAGLGNMAASLATGKGFLDSGISGLKNFGLASVPGMMGIGSGAAGAAGAGAPVIDGTGKLSSSLMSKLNAGNSLTPTGSGILSSLTGGGGSSMAPLAGMAGLHLLKTKANDQAYKDSLADRERLRKEYFEDQQRSGALSSYNPSQLNYSPLDENEEFYNRSEDDRSRSRFREPAFKVRPKGFAHGGAVRAAFDTHFQGPGKGQDDKILTSVPANTYVIDAQTTAYAGDGSTKAGAENWAKWGQEMMNKHALVTKNPPKKRAYDRVRNIGEPEVSVATSDGEGRLPPEVVASVGKGDVSKGARIIKTMVRNIREEKTRNRGGMPPKIKPLSSYMPRGAL